MMFTGVPGNDHCGGEAATSDSFAAAASTTSGCQTPRTFVQIYMVFLAGLNGAAGGRSERSGDCASEGSDQ